MIRRNPFDSLLQLQNELQRAAEKPLFAFGTGLSGRGAYPPVNVFRGEDAYHVRAEIPGVDPAHIEIESEGRTLTLRGERKVDVREGASQHRRERSAGKFSRTLTLPADLDLAQTEAKYRHGVLSLRIPKREEAKRHQIAVAAA